MHDDLTWQRDGDTWRFSDGTVLPVVSGGDGEAPAAPADPGAVGGDAGGAAAAPELAAPAPAAEATPATPADPFDDDKIVTFDRDYVTRLREEAASHRVEAAAAKAYKEAFDGYDDDDRAVLLELAKTLRTDPETAAQWMAEQAQALLSGLGTQTPAPAGQQPSDPADADRPLTRAELDQYLAQRDQQTAAQRAQQEAIDGIYTQIREAKLDPESPDGTWILQTAVSQFDGDVAKAIDALKARDQKIIDDYLTAAKGDAAGGARTPPQTGAAREPDRLPGGFGADWSNAIRDRIRAQTGGR